MLYMKKGIVKSNECRRRNSLWIEGGNPPLAGKIYTPLRKGNHTPLWVVCGHMFIT